MLKKKFKQTEKDALRIAEEFQMDGRIISVIALFKENGMIILAETIIP
jgi:hypothetical protein